MDFGAIYAETRERVADLTRNLAAADLEREVPATPGWRVCDVAAHLAGVAADVLAGNLPGGPGEEWTAAQVESRRACTIGEVLDEWADTAVELEPKIAAAGPPMGFLVADVATHEQDVRGALRQSGFRDSAGVEAATQVMVGGVGRKLSAANLALRLRSGVQEWELGEGDPAVSVSADPFELFRALSGRRSITQVARWAWDGDPGPYFGLISIFPLRATDLVE
ncbi:MAG TPA: maleylpyruvate isomerase family mycothiol-dependent enzyme [Acidimicrobiales bacterium]|nr:maleylpyruvate isomerase family mycothiol-dependent enzyme [Acidimicrobiales bacterium]